MRVLGVAFVANGFVCLAVALFDPAVRPMHAVGFTLGHRLNALQGSLVPCVEVNCYCNNCLPG